MTYPIRPVTLPTGLRNGHLTPCQLQPVWLPGVGQGSMFPTAAHAFEMMAALCKHDTGVVITAVSLGDIYRSYEMQLLVFGQRYDRIYVPIRNVLTDRRTAPDGTKWYKRRNVAAVASPGTSNHGYGLAIDVAGYVAGKIVGITTTKAWKWLLDNAHLYGFSWESQAEPWHLRYTHGDAKTQHVLNLDAFFTNLQAAA